jgi:pimeloyl-ACP methyl ester carboxylesterase
VKLYPKFQEYFRKSKPPLLAIWGKNDPFFNPAGAEAFRKDLPHAKVQFLDTGHFAIETHVVEIAVAMEISSPPTALAAIAEKVGSRDE